MNENGCGCKRKRVAASQGSIWDEVSMALDNFRLSRTVLSIMRYAGSAQYIKNISYLVVSVISETRLLDNRLPFNIPLSVKQFNKFKHCESRDTKLCVDSIADERLF